MTGFVPGFLVALKMRVADVLADFSDLPCLTKLSLMASYLFGIYITIPCWVIRVLMKSAPSSVIEVISVSEFIVANSRWAQSTQRYVSALWFGR